MVGLLKKIDEGGWGMQKRYYINDNYNIITVIQEWKNFNVSKFGEKGLWPLSPT